MTLIENLKYQIFEDGTFYYENMLFERLPLRQNGTLEICCGAILERFQSKALRMIVDAPWYVPNTVIRSDLQIPTVKEKIRRYSSQYSARLSAFPNDLIVNLFELPDNRRLRRHLPNDLPTRFLV
jgi:hypothetical protein